jgi:hypothetical protein
MYCSLDIINQWYVENDIIIKYWSNVTVDNRATVLCWVQSDRKTHCVYSEADYTLLEPSSEILYSKLMSQLELNNKDS